MPVQEQDTAAQVKLRQALRSNIINIMSKYKDPGFAKFYLYQQGYSPEDINNEVNQISGFSPSGGFATSQTPKSMEETQQKMDLTAKEKLGTGVLLQQYYTNRNLMDSVKKYRDFYDETVKEGILPTQITGTKSAKLKSMYNDIIFQVAQAEGTGALQKADRDVVEEILPDVSSANIGTIGGQIMRGGKAGNISALDTVLGTVKNRVETLSGEKLPDAKDIQPGVVGKIGQPQQQFNQQNIGGAIEWARQNPNNPAAQKLINAVRSGEIDPITGQKKTSIGQIKSTTQEPTQTEETTDTIGTLGKVGQKLGEFFGGNKIGEAIGNLIGGKLAKYGEGGKNIQNAISFIERQFQEGKIDQAKRDKLIKMQEDMARETFGYDGPSFTELAGDAAQIALTLAPGAGLAGKATKVIGKIPLVGKMAGGLGKVAAGATLGYGYDVAGGLKEGEGVESFKPGVGTAVGAGLPVVGGAFKLGGKAFGALSRTLSGTPKKAFEYVVNNPEVLSSKTSTGQSAADDLIELIGKVKTGFNDVLQKKNISYQKSLAEINNKYAGKKIEQGDLLTKVQEVIGEFDSLEALPGKYKKLVNDAITTINNQKDFSPRGYDLMRMKIRNLMTAGEQPAAKTADTLLSKISNSVKSHVENVVPEIAKMNEKYGNDKDIIENIIKDLKPEGDKKALINRLMKVFDENSVFQKEAIDTLGEKKAKEIYDTVAKKIFGEWQPTGGIGRILTSQGIAGTILGTTLGGPGVGAATAGAVAMSSPKIVGKGAALIGKVKKLFGKEVMGDKINDVFWKTKAGQKMLQTLIMNKKDAK